MIKIIFNVITGVYNDDIVARQYDSSDEAEQNQD